MSIKRINQFPEGSGSLTSDDVFLFMDDPSNSGTTKKISLNQIANAIGGNASILKSTYSSGNEGGEIQLAKPVNSSLNGDVVVDVYQDKLRIFEGGGNSRGGYFDLTTMGNNASTNLSNSTNGTSFQISSVDLHNGGVQNAQVLKFDNSNYQSVITGPIPTSGNTAQRLIIQGQRAQGGGEGGDVYLWGGDADINGGDIKIYAGDADSNESGNGGYINIDAGNGHDNGGQVSISAGNSSVQGGNVNIRAGYPSGNVVIDANGGSQSWNFKSDGTVSLPSNTLDGGTNSIDIKSSNYAGLWYQSGPSGTPDNYIENPNNNSEAYFWTTYDGTHIENYRVNDGTNPSLSYEWHFSNDGKLRHPDGTTNSGGTVVAPGTYDIQSIENTLIQTSASAQAKTWDFGTDGGLTLPKGSILSETNNTVSLMPPTASSGQSLVIRPTAAPWSINSSNYIEYGNSITISVTINGWVYFGTVNYTISGAGVTSQSLGRELTGKITFSGISGQPDTKNITWTIPANSNISEFTFTLTSVDGTRPGPDVADANLYPELYYNFEESNGMPIGQFITVTNNGISSSEHSHVHLVSGDPSTVDIYLGDDDQYVKIEKNGGDVIVGTNSNTHLWTFDTDGKLILPGGYAQVVVEGDAGVRIGTAETNVAPNSQIKIGGAEHAFEIFGGPPGYSWKFEGNGELTLPASGSITFPDNTTQTSAGIPSNTGLVPNSVSITNMVSISQSNYDAIATKDPNTLYIINN
jgi:hypothetical protein